MTNLTRLINRATRRATTANPRAKQKQVSGVQARNFARCLLEELAKLPACDAGAILARYARRR